MRFNQITKLVAFIVAAIWMVPIIAVFILSIGNGPNLDFPPKGFALDRVLTLFENSSWRTSIWNSLFCGFVTVVLALVAAVPAAHATAALGVTKRRVALAMLLAPFPLSNLALALGQFFVFSKTLQLDTILPLAISHAVLAFPLAFLASFVGYSSRTQFLEMASGVFGADRTQRLIFIALPLCIGAISVAGLLSFITSFDESVSALLLTVGQSRTLPRQIFDGLRYNVDPVACAAATMSVTLWILVLLGVSRYAKKLN